MIDSLGRFGWFFLNIGVPVFAPVALLPLLSFSRAHGQSAGTLVLQSVRDGQLLWVVISMCASACYEIGAAINGAVSDEARAIMLAGLLWHGMIIVASTVVLSVAATDSNTRGLYVSYEEAPNRKLMWSSVIITAIVTASYSASHYSLT
jgi:hypothetical protein